jgi:hypothetical protein
MRSPDFYCHARAPLRLHFNLNRSSGISGTKYQNLIEVLKAERDKVMKAVLEMGHIPVGMEMFSAADE